MVSAKSVSRAAELLSRAASLDATLTEDRLERNLLVAAALSEVLTKNPVVVGGTAEDFWTPDEYHETDLDLITWSLTREELALLSDLGFSYPGARHWVHEASGVAVEFPETVLKGDERRVLRKRIGIGTATIIALEDLYLERVREATMSPDDEQLDTYLSALAIAASNFNRMDWEYVERSIQNEDESRPELMHRINRRIRRRLKQLQDR